MADLERQNRRWKRGAVAVLLLGGAAVLTGQAAPPRPATLPEPAGRYQVVNGTPDMTQNIMLLDSATGHTWVTCSDEEGSRTWCYMERSAARAAVRRTP